MKETANSAKQIPVYVGAARVGHIRQLRSGCWLAYSRRGTTIAPFPNQLVAECWVREELYRAEHERNPYDRYLPSGERCDHASAACVLPRSLTKGDTR